MVEDGAAVAGDVEIGISVVVEVRDGDSLSVLVFSSDAGFLRDVGKSSIAIVVVKRGAQGTGRFVNVSGRRLYEEQVLESVLIVVDPPDARAHGFKVILFFGLSAILAKGDSCTLPNIREMDCIRRRA